MIRTIFEALVKRLQKAAGPVRLNNGCFADLARDAADALATLSARVAELERERDSWREQFYAASNAASEYVGFWERHHGDFDAAGNYIPHSQMDGDLRAAEARADALAAEVEQLKGLLKSVLDACDQGRMVERGAGGMTIEAQIRRSVINGVPAWPIEEARATLEGKL